jgi:hypothetical protein
MINLRYYLCMAILAPFALILLLATELSLPFLFITFFIGDDDHKEYIRNIFDLSQFMQR